ncbi:DUF6368 family protein [Streptomyces sp. NPDC001817]|uniref:DUF6368 family protein n=1 Tax=Streptomyces sp. NPDC001817 TaxID=3154398 RepID=UPI0033243956
MSGPVLVIESAGAVPHASIRRVRELLVRCSARREEQRVGEYDVSVYAEAFRITDTGGWCRRTCSRNPNHAMSARPNTA